MVARRQRCMLLRRCITPPVQTHSDDLFRLLIMDTIDSFRETIFGIG